jgi:hypothetical protein
VDIDRTVGLKGVALEMGDGNEGRSKVIAVTSERHGAYRLAGKTLASLILRSISLAC